MGGKEEIGSFRGKGKGAPESMERMMAGGLIREIKVPDGPTDGLVWEIAGKVRELLPGTRVVPVSVAKNNGVKMRGLEIRDAQGKQGEAKAVAPIFYVEDILAKYERTGDPPDAGREAALISKKYKEYGMDASTADPIECLSPLYDSAAFLGRVREIVVRRDGNEHMFSFIPHRGFPGIGSLEVEYIVFMDTDKTVRVTNDLLKALGISEEELEENAARNTVAAGYVSVSMRDALKDMGMDVGDGNAGRMYVVTNTERMFGASALLYPREAFGPAADEAGGDMFIIPSSIHELILIPVGEVSAARLRQVIGDVNRDEVATEDVLAGAPFLYARATGEITEA